MAARGSKCHAVSIPGGLAIRAATTVMNTPRTKPVPCTPYGTSGQRLGPTGIAGPVIAGPVVQAQVLFGQGVEQHSPRMKGKARRSCSADISVTAHAPNQAHTKHTNAAGSRADQRTCTRRA